MKNPFKRNGVWFTQRYEVDITDYLTSEAYTYTGLVTCSKTEAYEFKRGMGEFDFGGFPLEVRVVDRWK